LWFPWSINANLGIGLMLTIMPFLELLFFKKIIIKKRCPLTAINLISSGAIGLFSLLILIAIIKFDIKV
jgi:hypothetical protein